jgi:hypothetical protein
VHPRVGIPRLPSPINKAWTFPVSDEVAQPSIDVHRDRSSGQSANNRRAEGPTRRRRSKRGPDATGLRWPVVTLIPWHVLLYLVGTVAHVYRREAVRRLHVAIEPVRTARLPVGLDPANVGTRGTSSATSSPHRDRLCATRPVACGADRPRPMPGGTRPFGGQRRSGQRDSQVAAVARLDARRVRPPQPVPARAVSARSGPVPAPSRH